MNESTFLRPSRITITFTVGKSEKQTSIDAELFNIASSAGW